jgi:dihydroorotase
MKNMEIKSSVTLPSRRKKIEMPCGKVLLNGNIDVIATDHAPHTWEEKSGIYPNCPSGVPLIQHPLLMMLEKVKEGKMSLEMMVDKMSHKVAELFEIKDRGYIREGYFADLVLVNPNKNY